MEQRGEAPILHLLPTPAQVNLPPDLTKAQIARIDDIVASQPPFGGVG